MSMNQFIGNVKHLTFTNWEKWRIQSVVSDQNVECMIKKMSHVGWKIDKRVTWILRTMRDDRLWTRILTTMGIPWSYHCRLRWASSWMPHSLSMKCFSKLSCGAAFSLMSSGTYCTTRMAIRTWLRRDTLSSILSAIQQISSLKRDTFDWN